MDTVGYFTYPLPAFGEFGDIVWAPLSAFIFYKTFDGTKGLIGDILNGIEEILPFTDFIPSLCIMYFLQNKSK